MAAVPDSSTWVPETRYARNGDVHIAYQVFGEGEITFVGLPGIVSNLEVGWEDPELRRFMTGIASFARYVTYDKRGQGMSDPDAGVPTLDDRLGDLEAGGVAEALTPRFSVVSGGVACVVGAVLLALALPGFRTQRAASDARIGESRTDG